MWQTYKQVYDLLIKIRNSIHNCGIDYILSLSQTPLFYSKMVICLINKYFGLVIMFIRSINLLIIYH